jgi:site-specific DNA recombinase
MRKIRQMRPKRAVLYARVSTEEQGQGYSLPTQLQKCREYADEHGYTVLEEFQDMHTGTELDRPGLNDLYRFIDKNKVDVLIVYDIDRLSREVGAQAIIEMEMSRADVQIEYVLGQYAKTPEGELMKLIKAGIAQYENRQRAERSQRGKRGRAKAGYVICPGGRAPFGYDYISEPHKGWFVINEREAEVVRQMYSWLIDDGLSSYAIAKKLWEENILSKGDYSDVVYKKTGRGEWSPSTVRRIISNPVYKGYLHPSPSGYWFLCQPLSMQRPGRELKGS